VEAFLYLNSGIRTMAVKILYVEDEESLGKIVFETLQKQGFGVSWETSGTNVAEKVKLYEPDIILLDIMLPGVDGYTLCRMIREQASDVPIIFLTAKTGTADLVKGFESGGTDYVKKPFSMEELIVRIHNQLKLHHAGSGVVAEKEAEVCFGSFLFRPGLYELVTPTKTQRLSAKETQILSILLQNRNRLSERKEMLMKVWGDDSFFNTRNLDVYMKKIRNLLKEDRAIEIQTIKGMGHLLIEKGDG